MLKYKNEFSIAAMCRVLVVSRSGFYDWLVKQDKPRLLKHRQQQIDAHIAHAFNADKGRSGAIRVMLALDKKGIHYNRKTVALSLQRQGLRAKAARKFKATTQSKHNLPMADYVCSNKTLPPVSPIRNGRVILPIYGRMKAGIIWLLFSIFTRAK